MIRLGKEPEGALLRPQDISAWVVGLDREQWRKIRDTLTKVYVPGGLRPLTPGQHPFYRKTEVYSKLVQPIQEPNP